MSQTWHVRDDDDNVGNLSLAAADGEPSPAPTVEDAVAVMTVEIHSFSSVYVKLTLFGGGLFKILGVLCQ